MSPTCVRDFASCGGICGALPVNQAPAAEPLAQNARFREVRLPLRRPPGERQRKRDQADDDGHAGQGPKVNAPSWAGLRLLR